MCAVVLNWNGRDDTIACVESVLADDRDNTSVLVVDNGSEDGSVETFAAAWGADTRVRVLANGANLGYAGGNNAGLSAALDRGCDMVLVLNNDAIVEPGAIDALARQLTAEPTAGMAGPKVLAVDSPVRLACSFDRLRLWWFGAVPTTMGAIDRGQYDDVRELEVVTGCAMLIRAEALREVGGFDEDFFAYYEEVDLAFRMRKAGWRLVFVPEAIVRHEGGASTAGQSSIVQYYKLRNMILFMRKNARWYHFLTFVPIVTVVGLQRVLAAALRGDSKGLRAMLQAVAWHFGVGREWRPGRM